jgi:hypothetical protein
VVAAPPTQPRKVVPPPPPPPAVRTGARPPRGLVPGVVVVVIIAVIAWGVANLGDDGGNPGSNIGLDSSPATVSPSPCKQPDGFGNPGLSNADHFCTVALRHLAEPWLTTMTDCDNYATNWPPPESPASSGPDEPRESVTCHKENYAVTFALCPSRQNACPEGRRRASAGVQDLKKTEYRAKDTTGTKITGTRNGVPFVYWDDDSSAATGILQSTLKPPNNTPAMDAAGLQTVWGQDATG